MSTLGIILRARAVLEAWPVVRVGTTTWRGRGVVTPTPWSRTGAVGVLPDGRLAVSVGVEDPVEGVGGLVEDYGTTVVAVVPEGVLDEILRAAYQAGWEAGAAYGEEFADAAPARRRSREATVVDCDALLGGVGRRCALASEAAALVVRRPPPGSSR